MLNVLPAYADVYKYTGADGKTYYTDRPSHQRYKLIIRSRPKGYANAFKSLAKNFIDSLFLLKNQKKVINKNKFNKADNKKALISNSYII